MPSPPPRKVKPTVWLKEIQSKQLSVLQAREQQLLDIIEDIKTFSKQRSDIERIYGQSLQKLCAQLLAKKELFQAQELDSDPNGFRTVQTAWQACLQETEKLAQNRIRSADHYSSRISEPCRTLKSNTMVAVKKGLEQLSSLQADVSQTIKEMGVFHKQYIDDEGIAFEARSKSAEAENKLSNNKVGIFNSMDTLKKKSAKMYAQMFSCSARATSSRNSYLLELAAVNAHTTRLHNVDIPQLFQAMDDKVFEGMSEFISLIGQTEIDCCKSTLASHPSIVQTCQLVNPQYNLSCFIRANEVFAEPTIFPFDPVQNDPINILSTEFKEEAHLEKETRNWARKVAKENKTLSELRDKLSKLELSPSPPSIRESQLDIRRNGSLADMSGESELTQVQNEIRKAEIAKLKAEARLNLLRAAGMSVDAILMQATAEPESLDTQSQHSFGSSQQSIDMSFDSASDTTDQPSNLMNDPSVLYSVRAIYNYQANHTDELTLTENEVLSILDEGHGDGWYRASNAAGKSGLVPQNYIERLAASPMADSHIVSNHHDQATLGRSSQVSQLTIKPGGHSWCRALYDYCAEGDDEISFSEGQMIKLLGRDEHDDGYWKGEVDGRVGLFPSLVVEEVTDQYDWTPDAVVQTVQAVQLRAQAPVQTTQDVLQQNIQLPQSVPQYRISNPPPLPSIPDADEQTEGPNGEYKRPQATNFAPEVDSSQDQSAAFRNKPQPHTRSLKAENIYVNKFAGDSSVNEQLPVVTRRNRPSGYSEGTSKPCDKPPVNYASKPGSLEPQETPAIPARNKTAVIPRHKSVDNSSWALISYSDPLPWPTERGQGPASNAQNSDGTGYVDMHAPEQGDPGHDMHVPEQGHMGYYDMHREAPGNNIRNRYHEVTDRPASFAGHSHNEMYPPSVSELPHRPQLDDARYTEQHLQPSVRANTGHLLYEQRAKPYDPSARDKGSDGTRSYTSVSSSESLENSDKLTPIRVIGRPINRVEQRPTSLDLQPSARTPMSVRDADRLSTPGKYNPSYRIAVDQPRVSSASSPPRTPNTVRQARQGGLPGHVRDGIKQGRKALSEVAKEPPIQIKRQLSKSETSV